MAGSRTSATPSRATCATQGDYGIVEEYGGHGIGTEMHQDPHVLNYGRPGRGPKLVKGLALAVEPMITLRSPRTRLLADDWTVVTADGGWAAHFEHTFTLTEQGPWVLTALDGGAARLAGLGVTAATGCGRDPGPVDACLRRRPRDGGRTAARRARRGPADHGGVRGAARSDLRGQDLGELAVVTKDLPAVTAALDGLSADVATRRTGARPGLRPADLGLPGRP